MDALQLNTDLSQRCVVASHELPWSDSPSPLVQRRLLEDVAGFYTNLTDGPRSLDGLNMSCFVICVVIARTLKTLLSKNDFLIKNVVIPSKDKFP